MVLMGMVICMQISMGGHNRMVVLCFTDLLGEGTFSWKDHPRMYGTQLSGVQKRHDNSPYIRLNDPNNFYSHKR